MVAGARHINGAGRDVFLVTGFTHRTLEPAGKDLGQVAVAIIRQMQHAHQRNAKRRRQGLEHRKQGADAPRRGTKGNRLDPLHDLR
ncbi:hypothetical protein D3C76_1527170 [compost metagenome]